MATMTSSFTMHHCRHPFGTFLRHVLLIAASLPLISSFTPLRPPSTPTFLPSSPIPHFCPSPHPLHLSPAASGPSRRESRLYGLFNNKATPSSEPPPKPSLFNRLLGTPRTRTATEKGSGRKRKLVRKKVKA